MPRFHHANLGVPPGVEDSECSFLVDVLLYRKVRVPPDLQRVARWFEAEDGSQIHLSIDPDHRPAAVAHTAIEVDDAIEVRLDAAGIAHTAGERDGVRVVFCDDPAGNRWELRRSISLPGTSRVESRDRENLARRLMPDQRPRIRPRGRRR